MKYVDESKLLTKQKWFDTDSGEEEQGGGKAP